MSAIVELSSHNNTDKPDFLLESYIRVHTAEGLKTIGLDIFKSDEEAYFGLLTIPTRKMPPTSKSVLFKIDIDISDSMNSFNYKQVNYCLEPLDKKINYVKRTFQNMIKYLSEQTDVTIYIQVSVFNNKCVELIPITQVLPTNFQKLADIVNNVTPCEGTNIEDTFLASRSFISDYRAENPDNEIAYIILTDGEATLGNDDSSYLVSILPTDCDIFSIGYGKEHCARLLNKCGEYYYINDFELTSVVYSEIVYSMLYKVATDILICINDGSFIYDPETDSWNQTLKIKTLYSDRETKYALKLQSKENNWAIIYGLENGGQTQCKFDRVDQLPELHDAEDVNLIEPVDLSKYMYRCYTQSLLKECLTITRENICTRLDYKFVDYNRDKNKFKKKVQEFYNKMKQYMRENNLEQDTFMKVLCDDVYTCYKTTGSENVATHTVMRQRAQAKELSYRTATDELTQEDDYSYSIKRQNACTGISRSISVQMNEEDFESGLDNDNTENECGGVYGSEVINEGNTDCLNRYVSSTQPDDEVIVSETLSQIKRGVSGK